MAFNWFKKKTKTSGKDKISHNPESGSDSNAPASLTLREGAEDTPTTDDIDPIAETDARPAAPDGEENRMQQDPEVSQPAVAQKPSAEKRGRLMRHLKAGLTKTRNILTSDIDALFRSKNQIDDDMLEDIEEILITSDIGVQTTMEIMRIITKKAAKIENAQALKETLKQELLKLLKNLSTAPLDQSAKPHVVMVVGVNGVGKTTTIGKLAASTAEKGDRVLIAAADTFRAAAIEQLTIWADRSGAEIVKHKANADPAAVAFDSMEAAIARDVDMVFVDTAGRLHTKVNLMEELKKIKRTIAKKIPQAPHEVLLVLDATTGQNALAQAKLFHQDIGVSSLALTKLDGTAKGGIVISISQELKIPLRYIGVGEGIDDLQPFDPEKFADALFEDL